MLIDLSAIPGISRAIPPLASCVARRTMTFSAALDLLMLAFLQIKSHDPEFCLRESAVVGRWLLKAEARLSDRLEAMVDRMRGMLEKESLVRRIAAGDRLRYEHLS